MAKINVLILLILIVITLPVVVLAAPERTAAELQKQAGQAYAAGRYTEAEAINLQIVDKHPGSEAHRYAILMLGNLYENNLVDLKKAIKWHREYLTKYATPRQVSFYKEKLALLEQLLPQETAYRKYQAIRSGEPDDRELVEKYEALLIEHPDFLLEARVVKELGYAYGRLDQRWHSYRAFLALSEIGGKEFTASDQLALEKARHYWRMTLVWGGVAWAVVIALWALALLVNPWQRLNRSALKTFMTWAGLWLLLAGARIPSYFAIQGEDNLFQDGAVYWAAVVNVPILFWLLLLVRGKYWQPRPRTLIWLGPVLAILMTTAVFYLFLIHQPRGAEIVEVFAGRYRDWVQTL